MGLAMNAYVVGIFLTIRKFFTLSYPNGTFRVDMSIISRLNLRDLLTITQNKIFSLSRFNTAEIVKQDCWNLVIPSWYVITSTNVLIILFKTTTKEFLKMLLNLIPVSTRRRFDVDTTLFWRWKDVVSTLKQRCVLAGIYILWVQINHFSSQCFRNIHFKYVHNVVLTFKRRRPNVV